MPSMIRLAAAVAAFAFAATLAPAAAQAQTISACYTNKNGTMYRVGTPNTPANCTSSSHVKETWNVQGAPGVSGMEVVYQWAVVPVNVSPVGVSAACPTGKQAIAGSWDATSNNGDVKVHVFAARPKGDMSGYDYVVKNLTQQQETIYLYVTCAKVQ